MDSDLCGLRCSCCCYSIDKISQMLYQFQIINTFHIQIMLSALRLPAIIRFNVLFRHNLSHASVFFFWHRSVWQHCYNALTISHVHTHPFSYSTTIISISLRVNQHLLSSSSSSTYTHQCNVCKQFIFIQFIRPNIFRFVASKFFVAFLWWHEIFRCWHNWHVGW